MSAFSDQAFGGNGCVVVHGAADLNLETRLNIVRETSLSECTFIEPSDVADFRFRIYLASREVPFAGHPTLAGVASLMHRGLLSGRKVIVETHAGIVPLEVLDDGQISMTQIAPEFGANVPAQLVADAVSLSAMMISSLHHKSFPWGCSSQWRLFEMRDALGRAKLDIPAVNRMSNEVGAPNLDIMGPFLVTLEGANSAGDTFSRLLLAPPNLTQDPFTGSATGAMASYLWSKGLIESLTFIAEQGHDMGRPGQAFVEVLGSCSDITGVKLAGKAYVIMSGHIHL